MKYAVIVVHEDVLKHVRALTYELELNLHKPNLAALIDEDEIRALKDLVDPLPEEDIYGITPRVFLSATPEPS